MNTSKIMMGKDEREAILANGLVERIQKAKGGVCRFDCGTGTIILGRYIFNEPFFWVEGDEYGTYVVKGNRFFNVSGGEIRKTSSSTPETITKTSNKKEKKVMKETAKDEKKTVVLPKGGETVKHLGYDGKEEELNAVLYCNKFVCKCGNIRYVKNADMFQVKACKPCMSALRKKKISNLKQLKNAKKAGAAKSADAAKALTEAAKKPAAKKPAAKKDASKKKG